MSLHRASWQLFGVDLYSVIEYFRDGWAQLRRWPSIRACLPFVTVRLLDSQGGESFLRGNTAVRQRGLRPPKFAVLAAELPEELVLLRRLRLPAALRFSEIEVVIRHEISANCPFGEDDRVTGWRRDEQGNVLIAIARRSHVQDWLARLHDEGGVRPDEVWVGRTDPVIMDGFGEARRRGAEARQRLHFLVLLVVAMGLLLALAATPVLQERLRAFDAQERLRVLEQTSADAIAARGRLSSLAAHADEMRQIIEDGGQPLQMLELLSRVLPDDTFLNRIEIHGNSAKISGQTVNSAALMELLGKAPEVSDVKAPSASRRNPNADKESFVLEVVFKHWGKS